MESTPMTLTPSEKRANVDYMKRLARFYRQPNCVIRDVLRRSLRCAADQLRGGR
jgi:predicted transcriptional regulator